MTFLNFTLNFLLNMNYEFKSFDSWYGGSHDDKVESWINSLHPHTTLLESWNKLLEVVDDSSKGLKGIFLVHSKEFSKLNSQLYFEFELWIKGYDHFRTDFRCL